MYFLFHLLLKLLLYFLLLQPNFTYYFRLFYLQDHTALESLRISSCLTFTLPLRSLSTFYLSEPSLHSSSTYSPFTSLYLTLLASSVSPVIHVCHLHLSNIVILLYIIVSSSYLSLLPYCLIPSHYCRHWPDAYYLLEPIICSPASVEKLPSELNTTNSRFPPVTEDILRRLHVKHLPLHSVSKSFRNYLHSSWPSCILITSPPLGESFLSIKDNTYLTGEAVAPTPASTR